MCIKMHFSKMLMSIQFVAAKIRRQRQTPNKKSIKYVMIPFDN